MSSQATTSAPSQPLSSSSCCESGRPIITDPLTGQTVCSCQYDSQAQQLLNYQRLASSLPLNVYGAPYGDQSYLPLTAAEQSAFYTPSDNLGTWPYPASMYYPYDPTLSGYPFANGYGVDLNGARRKNATRETTSTLKAWLSEHRKNPYPTKGEKIMLAIITKMTLTQVSTWFANARRRLKKDNKVTWEPRNRVDDDDNEDASDTNERDSAKLDKDKQSAENGFGSACPKTLMGSCNSSSVMRSKDIDVDDDDVRDEDLCLGNGGALDTSQRDSMSSPGSSILSDSHSSLQSPVLTDSPGTSVTTSGLHEVQGSSLKPRIWSIVDTATSHGSNHQHHHHNSATALNNNNGNNFMGVGFGVGGAGLFASGSGAGGPALKVSQQFARNLRLGYASPYAKAAWFNGAFGSVPSSIPATSLTTVAAAAAAAASTTTVSASPSTSSMALPPSSVYSTSACTNPTSPLTAATSTTATLATNGQQTMDACNLILNPLVKSTSTAATASTATTATSYPMSIAAAAAAAHGNPSAGVNSALFGRTYAQTIHNLTNLTKGLNHLMAPQLGGAFIGSMKTSQVQQDQRSELQTSTS